MAGIWNINSTYNLNSRKIMNKLSFELGEEFLARIVDVDMLKNEVLLKMLDGWQFQAELQNKADSIPEGVLRFKVEGYEDGKLKLKILNPEKDLGRDINNIIKTLEEQNIDVSKDDFKILDKMIKHSMPLTRENISEVKSIFDFKNKIENAPEEIDNFIQKFLESKEINPSSEKGKEFKVKLKVFFEALKNVTENDILTLMENDLELNHENIKSFSRVFKESQIVYRELASFSEKLIKNASVIDPKQVETVVIQASETETGKAEPGKAEAGKNEMVKTELVKTEPVKTEPVKTEPVKIEPVKIQTAEIETPVENTMVKKLEGSESRSFVNESKTIKPEVENNSKERSLQILSDIIREEIKTKSDSVKNAVRDIISNMKDGEEGTKETIINFLQSSGNDFKILNTVSNQYYYFDLPLKVENHEYGCKLIIKDERKKGKKIDSNDVKIAAAIKTENMGIVDSYITVKNYNMAVEIKSEEKFMKLISSAKEILLKELSNLGYNISVKVNKRDKPVSISDSREFFQDNDFVNINVRV